MNEAESRPLDSTTEHRDPMKIPHLFRNLLTVSSPVILIVPAILLGSVTQCTQAAVVNFMVDPGPLDTSPMDGFITGTEFSPIGSDGTLFTMIPTDNLTGTARFQLDAVEGLKFGGGGGSTLSFDFAPNHDILLNSYTLGTGFFSNDPLFDIREGANVLSLGNSSGGGPSSVNNFAGGPIALSGGTNYSFVVTNASAATQSFLGSIDYTVTSVPEPSSIAVFAVGATIVVARRRKRNRSLAAC